jgi:predicted ribosome quality control (RQC) complex YloA/Tae2 family protein
MTTHLHFEDAFTSIFKTIINSLDTIKKDFVDTLLMTLIVTMQNKDKELRDMLFEIEENPNNLLDMNLEDLYDTMLKLEDNFKKLLKLAEKNKDKSDMLMQFYKTIDNLYSTSVYVNVEIGFIEAELSHALEMKSAS